jgi:Flp pilus assembly protein TadD
MQLGRWEDALRAFSRVVQLEPEEHEAWANVAAVHMHNKNPAEAYPALQEVRLLCHIVLIVFGLVCLVFCLVLND